VGRVRSSEGYLSSGDPELSRKVTLGRTWNEARELRSHADAGISPKLYSSPVNIILWETEVIKK
jgi:tRNA A-37 threonylcarbamoyl transferase component Bud32